MPAFRSAAPADAPAVVALVNSAYRGDYSKRGWTTEADILGGQRTDQGKILEMIRGSSRRVELAENEGNLVACVQLRKERDGTCYLGMLTVEPSLQACGLGKAMLSRAEAVARAWGCRRIRMTVISLRTELLAWYGRRGYAATGKTEAFPENDARFGLPKIRGMRFLELAKRIGPETRSPAGLSALPRKGVSR